jgi:hypothetical protein
LGNIARQGVSLPLLAIQQIIDDMRLYAFEWGELVRILGGFGRDGQVTPPA